MTPYDRAACFEAAFADFVPFGAGFIRAKDMKTGEERFFATWSGGQDYKNKSRMYGAYPSGYRRRALSLFPDAQLILDLFSGSLTKEQIEADVQAVRPHSGCGPFRHDYTVKDTWPGGPQNPSRCRTCDAEEPSWRLDACGHPVMPVQIRFDSGLHPAAKAAKPDVIGDAETLAEALRRSGALLNLAAASRHIGAEQFDLILADPPYALADQQRYWRESWPNMTCGCGAPYPSHPEVQPGYAHTDRSCPDYPTSRFYPYFDFKPLNKAKVVSECHKVLRPGGWLVWLDQALPMYSKRDWIWRGAVTWIRSTQHRIRAAFFFEKRGAA